MEHCGNCGEKGCVHSVHIVPVSGIHVRIAYFCQECLESVDAWFDKHGSHTYFQFLDEKKGVSFSICLECTRAIIASMSNDLLQHYYDLIKNNNVMFFKAYLTDESCEYREGSHKEHQNLMYYVLNFARVMQLATVEEAIFRLVEEGSGCSSTLQ